MLQVVGFSASFQGADCSGGHVKIEHECGSLLIPISYPISVVDPNEPPVAVLSLEVHTCPL